MTNPAFLLQVFKCSPLPTVLLLPEATFTIYEANRSFLQAFSSNEEETTEKSICDFFSEHEDFKNLVSGLPVFLKKAIDMGEVQKISAGDFNYFEAAPVFSDEGKIQFIILYYYKTFDGSNCQNKNCLKEKQDLKISAEKYKKLFQLSPMPKWLYDLETFKILDVSESALEKYGYSREEFLNMTMAELRSDDQIPELYKALEMNEGNEGLIHFGLFTHLKKDKSPIRMQISGSRFSFQGKKCMMVAGVDVTDRENALIELRDIREKLTAAQCIAKIGYWKEDFEKNQLFWSDQLYNILELVKESAEAGYDLFYNKIVAEDQRTFSAARSLTLAGEAAMDIEFRIAVANGLIKWLHAKAELIKDEAGKPIFFEATFQDITKEKLLKLSLEESNQRFDYVTKATFDAVWDWDLMKDKTYWGEGFARTFGYQLSEINSDPDFWNNHIHPADFDSVMDIIQKSIKGDATKWSSEYRFQKANGDYVYVTDRCIIIRNQSGKAIRLVGAMQDISEKKILQQLLDKANRLAKIGSWEIDVANSTVYWSDITKEIRETGPDYQPTLEDGIGHFKEGYHRDTILARVKDSIEHGTSWQDDLQIYTHAGNLKWVRTTGKAELKDGKCVKIYGSFQDIDQSKKTELELIKLYEEKNEILESIGDGFFTVDKEWTVTYWNNEAQRMLGTSRQKILGKKLWDIFADEVNRHSFKKYHEAIEKQERIVFEDYYAVLDRWFEVSVYPSKNGLSVYFKDITDRITDQIELNELNLSLQKTARDLSISNAELEQFAYIASHDLQEPLRMITSFLTQLDKKYNTILDEKGKQYIYFAVDGAKRMRQIILDLLEFSRVGRFEGEKEKVDLNEIMEEVVYLYKEKIEETGASIQFNNLPVISAYKSPLRQVLQNLVSNALKYQLKDEKPFIEIFVEEMEFHWKFYVKDNGIGIDPDYYEKIFIIFQRLHKKEEYSGTGIGLAIVKKIITAMGGDIRIEPNTRKGSIFIFTISR